MHSLSGQKLTNVTVNPKTGASHFIFDLGCQLDCRRFDAITDAALWYLYFPRGKVLTICGDGYYTYESDASKDPARRPMSDGLLAER
jgi:hypothetical protein